MTKLILVRAKPRDSAIHFYASHSFLGFWPVHIPLVEKSIGLSICRIYIFLNFHLVLIRFQIRSKLKCIVTFLPLRHLRPSSHFIILKVFLSAALPAARVVRSDGLHFYFEVGFGILLSLNSFHINFDLLYVFLR